MVEAAGMMLPSWEDVLPVDLSEMRVAVVGGTGRAGREIVASLRRRGHEALVIARATGVDLLTGEGLRAALDGADAVVDASNRSTQDADEARAFFGTATRNVVAAESDAGVRHHVVLSIVGIDRVQGSGYYVGKLLQEEIALAGPIPTTIVRSTQFFDFAERVVTQARVGDVAELAPLLLQPVALEDVAAFVAQAVAAEPRNGRVEIAGPETQDLVDMARRTFAARGERIRLTPTWRGREHLAGEVLLPGPDAQIAPTTFDEWLSRSA
jgi:uncharacterized protein YbjT (DUF2867 family)